MDIFHKRLVILRMGFFFLVLSMYGMADANWSETFGAKGTNGTVYSLAFGSDGDLFVGGSFSSAGGESADNVARWDGDTWFSIGGGIRRTNGAAKVRSIIVDDRNCLYVGGSFDRAGNIPVNNIAYWNGNEWSSLNGGIKHGTVYSMANDRNDMYVGGYFDTASTISSVRRNGAGDFIGMSNGKMISSKSRLGRRIGSGYYIFQ